MILNFKTKKQETDASARVVDGKLILSLPDAITPVVWQMDLAQAKASALEVLHNEEKNEFSLGLKNPKGEKVEVAVFAERTHAVEGLMAASHALENAHGQIRGLSNNTNDTDDAILLSQKPTQSKTKQENKRGKLMTGLLALVVLFILFTIWSSIIPRTINTAGNPESVASNANAPSAAGVAVSADDFLRGQ